MSKHTRRKLITSTPHGPFSKAAYFRLTFQTHFFVKAMRDASESVRKCRQKHNSLRIAKNGKETLNSRTNRTTRRNRHCVNCLWHLQSPLTQQCGLPRACARVVVWLAKTHHVSEHLDAWIQFRKRIVCCLAELGSNNNIPYEMCDNYCS